MRSRSSADTSVTGGASGPTATAASPATEASVAHTSNTLRLPRIASLTGLRPYTRSLGASERAGISPARARAVACLRRLTRAHEDRALVRDAHLIAALGDILPEAVRP